MSSTLPNISSLADQLIDGGALGRSRIYGVLLKYLVNCAEAGRMPKEMEIAIDVFEKDAEFDASKNSLVRVSIHQLRKKLERYYSRAGAQLEFRLEIPKGQYTVEVINNQGDAPTQTVEPPPKQNPLLLYAVIAACLLLCLNLGYWVLSSNTTATNLSAERTLWQPLFSDDRPIMIVMGDYYIFGELDEVGNVGRMVRDFSVNSKNDLEALFNNQPDLGWRYRDLDLTYLPEGSAPALNNLLPIFSGQQKTASVKMMSELSIQDTQTHHIIYVGYISALDQLQRLVFAASNLSLGENYDQVVLKENGKSYTSDAGLPSFDKGFVDYGLISTFPTTAQTRVVIIAGMRDAGLAQAAGAASHVDVLAGLEQALKESGGEDSAAFEALYRVRGVDRTSLDEELIYASYMDADLIWEERFTQQ